MKCSCGGSILASNGFLVCQQCGLCHERDYHPSWEAVSGASHHVLAVMGTVVGASPATERLRRRQGEYGKDAKGDRLRRVCSRIICTGQQLGFSKTQLNQATYLATQLLRQVPRGGGEKLGLAVLCVIARQYRLPLSIPQLVNAYQAHGRHMNAHMLTRFLLEHPIPAWIPSARDWSIYLPEAVDVALRHLQRTIPCQGVHTSTLALNVTQSQLHDTAHQLLTELAPSRVTKALVAAAVYAACRQLGARVPALAWAGSGPSGYTIRMAWIHHFKPRQGRVEPLLPIVNPPPVPPAAR